MSYAQKAKSLSSTISPAKTAETTWYESKKGSVMATDKNTAKNKASSKQGSPKFSWEACTTLYPNSERTKLFERIALREKQIEQATQEHKIAQKMFYHIQFQHGELEKRGKGLCNPKYDPKPEPEFKPSLKKLPIPHSECSDEFIRKVKKPAPPEVSRPNRNPIEGELSQLVKQKNTNFTASVESQVINFKRFFLPSEWREFKANRTDPKTGKPGRPFSDIKAVLQYEYAK